MNPDVEESQFAIKASMFSLKQICFLNDFLSSESDYSFS